MRKYTRAVLRAKADRLSHYGRNGKSIKLFRMLWKGYQEIKGKAQAAAAKAAEKQKEKENKRDKGLLSRIAGLKGKRF